MQTLHPEVLILIDLLYEPHNKNVRLDRYEIHKKVALNLGQSFEDYLAYELTFVLFKTPQTKIQRHL